MIPHHVLKLRHYGGSPGSLAFFRRMAIAVVVSQGVYAGRHTRRMDWRGRPSCGKQQQHSRGLPLEPVSAELIFPVTSPTCLSPSVYSEPGLQAAGSSPGAVGVGLGWTPSPSSSFCLLHQTFKTHKRFFFSVLVLYKGGVFRPSQGGIFYGW